MKLYLDPYLDRVKGEMELKIESSYWKSKWVFADFCFSVCCLHFLASLSDAIFMLYRMSAQDFHLFRILCFSCFISVAIASSTLTIFYIILERA